MSAAQPTQVTGVQELTLDLEQYQLLDKLMKVRDNFHRYKPIIARLYDSIMKRHENNANGLEDELKKLEKDLIKKFDPLPKEMIEDYLDDLRSTCWI